jgi:hypothetical protein
LGNRDRRSSPVKHRPTDVVPQPLVVKNEFANRLRELVTLPLTLASPRDVALTSRRCSTSGLDRIGGRAELVRGDVCDAPGLTSRERGEPCGSAQISGRAHGMATGGARLHHRDLATHPGASMLDGFAWSRVIRLCRLEEVEHVLRA